MSRILDAICETGWAMLPGALDQLREIAAREHTPDFESVEAIRARRMDSTESGRMRDGIAILPVLGPIFRRATMFTEVSGGASVELLARDFHAALNDPSVRGILLNIDSPGGQVNGINELAQMIYAARGRKPITAYVGGLGASAAYWIASAADEIVVDASAMLGSVGVVLNVPNKNAKADREYVASRSPNKRPDPDTETGNTVIQKTVDALADVFYEAVARNRGLTVDQVVGDFNEGGLLVGQAAVAAKMADRLGSFEGLLAEMSNPKKSNPKSVYAAADLEEDDMKLADVITALKAQFGSAELEEKPAEETKQDAPPPATEENVLIDSIVVAELEAKLADEKRARAELLARTQKADAENFINSMILSAHVYPAEKDGLIALYGQFAADDAANPLAEGTRVEAFEAAIRARPKHGLLTESLDPQKTRVLLADNPKTDELSPERRKELLSKTDLGAAALKVVK